MTSAYRTVLDMRRAGGSAQTTEHRLPFSRVDLFNSFDLCGYLPDDRFLRFRQAYEWKHRKGHELIVREDNKHVMEFMNRGVIVEHAIWIHRPRKWTVYYCLAE